MSRWTTRFRRAAAVLVGVHLLQVILLAASAVCDRSVGDAGNPPATVAATATHHHDGHGSAHGGAHDMPSGESAPETPPHTSHTTSCPMAMACAATAIVVPVPMLASGEVRVRTEAIRHDAHVLRSAHHAPEPPPPRG